MNPHREGKLRVLDLFSGIGCMSLGLDRTGGFQTVAFCENEPFPAAVFAQHWPGIPNLEDVTTAEFTEGMADVVVGGFPCQDLSDAGLRAGLSGERSGLYRELVRAIRVVRPKHAIVENVAALLNRGMGTVLGDMAEIGYDLEWDCVPAEVVGAPHERDRVWIVAHSNSEHWRPGTGRQDGAQAGDGLEPNASLDATNATREQARTTGQPRRFDGMETGGCETTDTPSLGCGSRRTRRPPDSFARVRDEARRNAADPYGARLAFGQSIGRNTPEERAAAQRSVERDGQQSVWPSEPALLGVDDECADRVDRVKALGNALVPKIPELIGRAILEAERASQ
jgi:DNA (cytosine-5)-methyltransferase 1